MGSAMGRPGLRRFASNEASNTGLERARFPGPGRDEPPKNRGFARTESVRMVGVERIELSRFGLKVRCSAG